MLLFLRSYISRVFADCGMVYSNMQYVHQVWATADRFSKKRLSALEEEESEERNVWIFFRQHHCHAGLDSFVLHTGCR